MRMLAGWLLMATAAEANEPLRSIREVRSVSSKVALTRLTVELDATVLYADPEKNEAIVDDGTASCYVRLLGKGVAPVTRDRVHIHGQTWQFGLFPHIEAQECRILGKVALPAPQHPGVDELFLPSLDSGWVELPALVTGVEAGGLGYTLVVEVFGHEMKANLPQVPDADQRAASLMMRRVRMTCVAATIFNAQMQMAGRHFFIPSFDLVVPTSPPPGEGDAPLVSTLEILTGNAGPDRPVRISGVVTHEDAKGFFLRDECGSAFVQTAMMGSFSPGTRVSAIGFGRMAPYRPILRAAAVTRTGDGPAPRPKWLDPAKGNLSELHDELVELSADFVGLRHGREEDFLLCRSAGAYFEALLPRGASGEAVTLAAGDELMLSGICKLITSRPMPRPEWADGFQIQLAGVDGLRVLRKAPWWTNARLLYALGIAVALCSLSLAGVLLLRRRVAGQMEIISNKLRSEAVHTERDRMARELHDTLEQQLAGVSLLVDGIARATESNPDAVAERVCVARKMIRHTRAEARRSVWDLRSRILESAGLAAALREMAGALGAKSEGPAIELHLEEPLPTLPKGVDFHLLRIAQEALGNAVKHASADRVIIDLRRRVGALVLSVMDDGCGFTTTDDLFDDPSHFGMVGMHQRADRIGARLLVESSTGNGCRISVELPI